MVFEKVAGAALACATWLITVAPVPVDIVELTTFDWQPGDDLPEKLQALDGHRVTLEGYMHTTKPGVRREFLIVADTRCRCSGTPPPNKFVKVILKEGDTDFLPGKLSVAGVIEVGEESQGGFVTSIYRVRGGFAR